ncbi:MAG: outer membrane protein assembly factor BamA [Oligoflexia bacterium]|nr:outer membrane protein assembly factor BamA [Oligoflexia bacterium]
MLIFGVPMQSHGQTSGIKTKKATTKKTTSSLNNQAQPPVAKRASVVYSGQVSRITVTGNKKIEADAIKVKLKSKVGEPFDRDSVRQDVQSVYDMGYFYNVQVERQVTGAGIELTYQVTEKPSIVEVTFKGNDRIDKDDLEEAAQLKSYTILDHNKLRETVDKLNKLYEEKGFFLARIKYRLEDVKPNEEVRVVFDIKENDKVRVKKVTFLGNRALTDTKLKGAMQTQEGGFFSWISGSGSYKQDVFDRDVSILNYLYFNEGYVQVKIDRPQVYVSPDKKSISITIRVEEGEQFNVGKVDFAGDLLFTRDELYEATEIHKSTVFVYETLQKDLKSLQFKYGDLGYAFANIIPKTQVREKERLVDITFEIEKGQLVYFGSIIVTGNSKTRDKVVRRELKIKEGELYNETRKRKSEENVKRLGYFSEVIFNSSTPVENSNVLNLDIQVKERSTGTLNIGAGFSTATGFLFNGSVSQANLFGKGQSLGISLNLTEKGQLYNLSFTEPYFNDTEWSVGFDLYKRDSDIGSYQEHKLGGDIRFGHPIGEYWNAYLTYKLENTDIGVLDGIDKTLFNDTYVDGVTSSITGSVVYDRRNDRWSPTSGGFASLAVEHAPSVLGSKKLFTKALANVRYYQELFWGLVFRNNLNYGLIFAPPGSEVAFNELFLLGGPYSLRGYSSFTIGKKRYACCRPVSSSSPNGLYPIVYGGTQEVFYQGEIEFPLITEAQIKGVVFYDIGQAEDAIILPELRQDVGFGFRWFSPIGPLRFEWGFPIQRREGELYQNFEFSIGSPF